MKTKKNYKAYIGSKGNVSSKKHIKYTNTYYLDGCYNYDKVYDLTRLIYHLKRLGLNEEPLMKFIESKDMKYVKSKNIKLKKEECYQDYNLPKLIEIAKIRPKFMFNHIHSIDKRFYNTKCLLSNILNYENFNTLKKHEIYLFMKDYLPEIAAKHMKSTFYISYNYRFNFPKIYILRPFLGSSGAEIFYISSEEELKKAINYYNTHNDFFKRDKAYHNYKVVASEYIMNPLLYKTKKFHLRMYYIMSIINGKFNSFFLDIGKILTAAKSFNTRLPFKKDVHDTHLKSTDGDIMFPSAFNDSNLNIKGLKSNEILEQMRTILAVFPTIIVEYNKDINKMLYDNQENGYNLYGVDFMIDDTGTVFLIEINKTPGITFHNLKNTSIFCNILFDWIAECVLEPCFKGSDASKHPTYLKLIKNI